MPVVVFKRSSIIMFNSLIEEAPLELVNRVNAFALKGPLGRKSTIAVIRPPRKFNYYRYCFTIIIHSISDVQSLTLRLTETPVPAQETTYMCQAFELPHDRDYHIIANEPYLDNRYVIHHMIAFGCDTDEGRFITRAMSFKTN